MRNKITGEEHRFWEHLEYKAYLAQRRKRREEDT